MLPISIYDIFLLIVTLYAFALVIPALRRDLIKEIIMYTDVQKPDTYPSHNPDQEPNRGPEIDPNGRPARTPDDVPPIEIPSQEPPSIPSPTKFLLI
jgi:hypothetical protein